MRPILALSLTLALAACGPGDPYQALGDGDHARAVGLFDAALQGKDASDSDFEALSIGKCEALAGVDAEACKKIFLETAEELNLGVNEYSSIVSHLVSAGEFMAAIDLLVEGEKRFPDDPLVKKMIALVVQASKNDSAAQSRLAGLGYL